MDIAQLAGLDYEEVEIDGRVYKVGELSLREWAPVQAWIKANAPRPLSSVRSQDLEGLSLEDRERVLKFAYQENKHWPPMVGTRDWFRSLDEPGGQAVLLLALLSFKQPAITLDDCERILPKLNLAKTVGLVLIAMGMPSDPKRQASTTKKTGTKKARRKEQRTTSERSPTSSPRRSAGRGTKSST